MGLYRVQVGGKSNDDGDIVGGQWGLVDSLGKVLIKPQYDYIESVSMGLYRVNVGGKSGILGGIEGGQWGLVDSLGKVLINPQYETINYDSRGFYKVTLRNKEGFVKSLKWGINNTEGTEIISPMYEEIISTNHSELLIVKKSEKWGVVNARGEEKITIIYDEIIDKKDGFFQVNRSGKWGLIRYNGREILPAIYDFIGDFINNTARVNIGGTIESKYFEDIKGGTWGVIDTSGTVVIQPKYDELSELSHGIFFARTGSTYDLLRVDQKTLFDKKNDYVLEYKDSLAIINHGGEIDRDHEPTGGKSGIINRFGVELISPQFDDIAILSNKLIAINQGGSIYNEDMLIGGKWGLLNLSSQKLIPVKYEAIKVFSNGFIAINIGGIVKNHDIKGGKWGLLNSIGEEVFPPKYEFITSLSNGSFQVNQGGVYDDGNVYNNDCCLIGGRWGLINLDGQEIVPPMYDFMEDFKEGYAKIRIADKWGLLKDNGKVIVPVKYIALASLGKGKAIVQEKIPNSSGESEEIWKIVDSLGYEQKLAEHIYEVFEPHNGIAQIRSWERAEYDNKLGLIDSLGNIILTPKYTGIDNVFKNSRARVINSEYGKWGIINDKGEEVVPPIYEFISEIKKGVASFSVGSSIESRFDGEYVIGGTWGLMNVDQGKILTEPKYQFLSITHDGIGKVNVGGSTFNDYGEIIGGKWGLINSKGEEITKIIYDELTFLGNGLFKVKMGGRWDDDYLHGGKEGLITHLGQELVPAKYEEIESFRDGYSKAIIAKKIGLLSINGEVLPPIYTNIYFVGYHIFLLEQNGRFGLYAPDHGVFLPCNYEEIGYLKEEKDWIRVKQNGKWGWVDKKGKVMIPIRYDAIAPFEDGKAPVIQLPYEDHFFINYQGEFFLESLRKREEE